MKKIIAANWKMNKGVKDTLRFLDDFLEHYKKSENVEVIVCPPFTSLHLFGPCGVSLGAQNLYYENKGAYTGEVSAAMLAELQVKYVIVGHSERRAYFGETDQIVGKKVHKALDAGLIPIICIGETLGEREAGKTHKVLTRQIEGALDGIHNPAVIFAYEPVWAIGTGKNATPEDAEETILFIKQQIKRFGLVPPVLYGGSMNEKNAKELLKCPAIDGGAGLEPKTLLEIIASC